MVSRTSGRLKNRHHGKYLGVSWCGEKLNEGMRSSELRNYEDGDCGEAQKWTVRGAESCVLRSSD